MERKCDHDEDKYHPTITQCALALAHSIADFLHNSKFNPSIGSHGSLIDIARALPAPPSCPPKQSPPGNQLFRYNNFGARALPAPACQPAEKQCVRLNRNPDGTLNKVVATRKGQFYDEDQEEIENLPDNKQCPKSNCLNQSRGAATRFGYLGVCSRPSMPPQRLTGIRGCQMAPPQNRCPMPAPRSSRPMQAPRPMPAPRTRCQPKCPKREINKRMLNETESLVSMDSLSSTRKRFLVPKRAPPSDEGPRWLRQRQDLNQTFAAKPEIYSALESTRIDNACPVADDARDALRKVMDATVRTLDEVVGNLSGNINAEKCDLKEELPSDPKELNCALANKLLSNEKEICSLKNEINDTLNEMSHILYLSAIEEEGSCLKEISHPCEENNKDDDDDDDIFYESAGGACNFGFNY